MIARILAFSVRGRWYVLLFTIAAAIAGGWALTVLPIDAVPDITNVQVQINAFAPALSPLEIEKQVTFPIETALAGIPGLERTRSFSRNGFAQITAVFDDGRDIYFARQQVDRAPRRRARAACRRASTVKWGRSRPASARSTVGGRIRAARSGCARRHAGLAARRHRTCTPEGERLADEVSRLVYLRTVQDWIIRPQLKTVRGVAGVDAIGGYVKQYQIAPDVAKLVGYGLSVADLVERDRGQQREPRRELHRALRRRLRGAHQRAGRDARRDRRHRGRGARRHSDPRQATSRRSTIGHELRTAAPASNGHEVVLGTVLMLIGGNSRTVAAAVDAQDRRDQPHAAAVDPRSAPSSTAPQLVDATIAHGRDQPRRGRGRW